MPYADSDYERSWKMQTKGVMLYPATLERLYAAAPEMLDALKSIERKWRRGDGAFSVGELCRQVIAKAEGMGE